MYSDSESLAFVEEDAEFGTPTPHRPTSAGDSSTRPPLHNRGGGSPSAFIAPTKKGPIATTDTSNERFTQQSLRRSGSVASNASIAFHEEEEQAPPVAPPGTRTEPSNTRRGSHAHAPAPCAAIDNDSIAFQVMDSPSVSMGRKSGNRAQATVFNDSIAFQFEEGPAVGGAVASGLGTRRNSRNVSPTMCAMPVPTYASHRPAQRSTADAAPAAPTVANDSITFHFEDEATHSNGHNAPPAKPTSSVFRLPETGYSEAASDIGSQSIVFQMEESGFMPVSGDRDPQARGSVQRIAGGGGDARQEALRADKSVSSIQFTSDVEEDDPSPLQHQQRSHPLPGAASYAGSSVSAYGGADTHKKTVVSNHLKHSSARTSPVHIRPSLRATPETHPPLYQPKQPNSGLSTDAGKPQPTTPAEAAEAARRQSTEVDEKESAQAAAAVPSVDLPKRRRRKPTADDGGSNVHTRRRRTSSANVDAVDGADGQPRDNHSHHHSHHSGKRRVRRSSSSQQKRGHDETDGVKAHHGANPPASPREAGTVTTEDEQSEHSVLSDVARRQPSGSMPNTARTQRPDRYGSVPQQEEASPPDSSSVDQLVTNHLDRVEAENAFFRDGRANATGMSEGDTRRSSQSSALLRRPPLPPHPGGGQSLHRRTSTATFVEVMPSASGHGAGGTNGVAEEAARRQTEVWRIFNKQQRAEIERLQRRIAAAKRQDQTLLESGSGFPPSASFPFPHGGKHPIRGGTGGAAGYAAAAVGRAAQGQRPSPSPQPQRRQSPGRGRAVSPNFHSRPETPRRPHLGNGDDADAAATVAHLLGIAWPPSRLGDLYFVTGSRLTQQQVDNFYDTVRVQQQHDQAERDAVRVSSRALTVLSPSRALRSPSRRSPSPPQSARKARKPTVRRSQVLREVFDLLDCNRRGFLYTQEIPALRHLIETELANLEARTSGKEDAIGPRGVRNARSPSGALLDAAAKHHGVYAKAYAGLSRGPSPSQGGGVARLPGYDRQPSRAPNGLGKGALTNATRKAVLLSFAVNVVLPLAVSSRIDAIDFPTLSLVVFSAIDRNDPALTRSAEGQAWRQVVAQYFQALSQ